MISTVRQKLLTIHHLTDDLVPNSNNNSRIIEILTERAGLLDELGESDEAQADRSAVRHIERPPNRDHSQLSYGRAAQIELQGIAERNGMRDLFR